MTVCHVAPGTSKWNKIEHHLFSHIAVNWRGQPLTSHEVIVDLIAATETQSGMKVKARLDKGKYPPSSTYLTKRWPVSASSRTHFMATGTTP